MNLQSDDFLKGFKPSGGGEENRCNARPYMEILFGIGSLCRLSCAVVSVGRGFIKRMRLFDFTHFCLVIF